MKMCTKRLLIKFFFCFSLIFWGLRVSAGIHTEKIDTKQLLTISSKGKANALIVVPPKACKIVLFAAEELRSVLKEACGCDFPVVTKAESGKINLLLGEEFLKKSSYTLDAIPRDGFIIRSQGNNIFLAGRDDPKGDPVREAGSWCKWERGTLYAVYHFLERFAGVRFYFPGKIGTVIPKRETLQIPAMNIAEAPDFSTRKVISGVRPIPGRPSVSQWYEGTADERNKVIRKAGMNAYRLRSSSYAIMAAHGLAQLGYAHRFAKSKPEFFALTDKGERYSQPRLGWDRKNHAGLYGQLCLSNRELREQVFKDAKAYLTGVSAAAAGIDLGPKNGGVRWPGGLIPGYFDIMPNDSFYLCRCAPCQAEFKKGPQAVSDHVWRFTKEIGERIKKENIPGHLTMMAYNPYRRIPSFALPDNIHLTLAAVGPWTIGTKRGQSDLELIRKWQKKCGTKIGTLWTYPGDPYRQFADLPMMTPWAVGKYFKAVSPHINGVFFEGETDHYLFQYLNFYIFSKVSWNNASDTDAMLKEHFALMFGPAANSMSEAYTLLEKCWLKLYARAGEQNSDKVDYPNEIERWTKIYDEKVMERISRLLKFAEKQTSQDKAGQARVKFMAKELFGPMLKAREKWVADRAQVANWSETVPMLKKGEKPLIDGKINETLWKNAVTVPFRMLNSLNKALPDNSRTLKVLRDENFLYVAFNFTSVPPSQLRYATGKGNQFWFESEAEIMLMPRADTMLQYACNPAGEVRTMSYTVKDMQFKLRGNSASSAKIKCALSDKGWSAEFAIPLKELNPSGNELKANFSYVESHKTKGVKRFSWSPYLQKSFQEFENYGTLFLIDKNLIRNGNFRRPAVKGKIPFWNASKAGLFDLELQKTRSNAPSLKGSFTTPGRFYCAQQIIGMKPDTRYRFSFFIRTEKLKRLRPGQGGAYATLYYGKPIMVPKTPLDGDSDWVKVVQEFTTGKELVPSRCSMTIGVYNVTGNVYFDSVKLEELGSNQIKSSQEIL